MMAENEKNTNEENEMKKNGNDNLNNKNIDNNIKKDSETMNSNESKMNDAKTKNEESKESNKNDEIHSLKVKINDQKVVIDEQDDRIKRLMAEFENFKKRSNKERENLYSSVMGDVVTKILPVMDNLEKAAQAETSDEKYKEGIIMCLNQFKDVLAACNVTEIKTVGEKFDPSLHEAVSSVVDDNLGEKIIKEEYRKGYKIGDRVIRHSLVVVAN